MARSRTLTEAQLDELCGWQIPVPDSLAARLRLYAYVKHGNATHGRDEQSRIQYARDATALWVGKRVRSTLGRPREGTVSYLLFRSKDAVRDKRAVHRSACAVGGGSVRRNIGAFELMILWDGASQRSSNSPASVELIETAPPV